MPPRGEGSIFKQMPNSCKFSWMKLKNSKVRPYRRLRPLDVRASIHQAFNVVYVCFMPSESVIVVVSGSIFVPNGLSLRCAVMSKSYTEKHLGIKQARSVRWNLVTIHLTWTTILSMTPIPHQHPIVSHQISLFLLTFTGFRG